MGRLAELRRVNLVVNAVVRELVPLDKPPVEGLGGAETGRYRRRSGLDRGRCGDRVGVGDSSGGSLTGIGRAARLSVRRAGTVERQVQDKNKYRKYPK